MKKKIISGIYKIENKVTEKVYIGSSKNIDKRWKQHISALKNKKHHSIKLQRAWDKYGEDSFEFSILEQCDEDKLLYLEQYYIDKNNAYNKGYNCKEKTVGCDNIIDEGDDETFEYKEYIDKLMKFIDIDFTDKKTKKRIENNKFKKEFNECGFYISILNFIARNFDIADTSVLVLNNDINKRTLMTEFSEKSEYMYFLVLVDSKQLILEFKVFTKDYSIIFNSCTNKDKYRTLFNDDVDNNNSVAMNFIGKVFFIDNKVGFLNDSYFNRLLINNETRVLRSIEIRFGFLEGMVDSFKEFCVRTGLGYSIRIGDKCHYKLIEYDKKRKYHHIKPEDVDWMTI